ncbi:carboxylesterase family protein [Curtobacterium sp. S6]|uniref:carboxylesterase family protein n=1 Tax=Curtobacterium sp. S6 TaxID=1479623 RepID=UPI000689B8C5|nr:carboxylesterase family protein [Curtobacterium sp. S6]
MTETSNETARPRAGSDDRSATFAVDRQSPGPWDTIAAPAGTFRTTRGDDVVRGLGIRYARAERFGAPVPHVYSEPFTADTPAPACPQRFEAEDAAIQALGFDEHCQRLSITRPAHRRSGLPVMIWIHGGSYIGGAGDLPHYDPSALVREEDIIVVNVTYRLGLFGYLGDGRTREANPGLLDQVEAVKWVHENIEAFGGDPERITIAGQSAGGHACWDLLLVPEIKGLIRRAIPQSAPLGIVHGRRRAWKAVTPGPEKTGRMRQATPTELAAAESVINRKAALHLRASLMPFSPQYGARPLPEERDLKTAWKNVGGNVEVLMGTTARESALFTGRVNLLEKLAGRRWGRRGVVEPLIRLTTQLIYAADNAIWAQRLANAGGKVGLYRFVYGRPDDALSCCHVAELPLLFPGPIWTESEDNAGAGVSGPRIVETFDPDTIEAAGRSLRRVWGGFVREGFESSAVHELPGILELNTLNHTSTTTGS